MVQILLQSKKGFMIQAPEPTRVEQLEDVPLYQ